MSVPIILALAAVVGVAVVLGVVINGQKDRQRLATALARTGAVLMAVFTVFAGAFIAGYALHEPGGTAGLMIILVWAVPILVLAVLAWFWPAGTAPLLMGLTAAFFAACGWFAFDPATARSFQETNGPSPSLPGRSRRPSSG